MFDTAAFDSNSFDSVSFDLGTITVGGAFDSGAFDTSAFDDGSFLFDDSVSSSTVTFVGAFLLDGTSLAMYFSGPVVIGSGGSTGISSTLSGGPVTWTYSSGVGTDKLTYTASRTMLHNESGSGSYTNPGNGIEDELGNDISGMSFVVWNRIAPVPKNWWWR